MSSSHIIDWPGRQEIARNASRRYRRVMWVMVGVTVLGGAAGGVVGSVFRRHSTKPRTPRHSNSVAGIIIVGVVIIACVAFLYLIFRWRLRHPRGFWGTPIVVGLTRRQRRTVGRDIRRGTPNTDPTMAAVEWETATRATRYCKVSTTCMVVVLLVEAGEIFLQHSIFGRAIFTTVAVVFLGVFVYSVWFLTRARHYLTVGTAPAPA